MTVRVKDLIQLLQREDQEAEVEFQLSITMTAAPFENWRKKFDNMKEGLS